MSADMEGMIAEWRSWRRAFPAEYVRERLERVERELDESFPEWRDTPGVEPTTERTA